MKSGISGLRGGNPAFSTRKQLDFQTNNPVRKKGTCHELATVVPTCTLNTKIEKGTSRIATDSSTTTAANLDRMASALKHTTREQKFVASLQRVWSAPHLGAAVTNVAESFLILLEPEIKPFYADSGIQLVDNFAPVMEECPPTPCLEVTGTIPACMNGVYVRNGSNPQFTPTSGYHVFDGDGMLHAVRIKDGGASYCCRFTRTSRYLQEKAAGHPLYPNALGELTGLQGFARLGLFHLRDKLGVLEQSKGIGTANAGLVFYNGRLLAISEDDLPYAVAISPEDGDLRTLGRYNISGKLKGTMTAHPKVDPSTGELFAYSYNVMTKPYVQYFRASPEGEINTPLVAINITEPVLLHDFAVTKNYAVIPDPVMVFRLSEMLAGKTPILMDQKKVTKFGILPKYAKDDSQIKWFRAPGLVCFHYLNAWEEGDEIVVVGSNNTPMTRIFNDPSGLMCYFTECRMNLKNGRTSQRRLSNLNLDVGRMNENYYGRKNRYCYLAAAGPWPKFSGIVKLDLEASLAGSPAEVGVRMLPPGCYCSEPFFVPRCQQAKDDAKEDDEFVVSYLHNENTNVSETDPKKEMSRFRNRS